ncbi:MAG: hypothetical protein KDB94_05160 [Acidobacteria bacterium]|nr:hypothetical protein [Acidobacteriota bacterium]MCB9378604.1 hypothetical protein [Holophagales bacterium]
MRRRHRPSDERAKEVFDRLEREIERRWGIPVRISDVPDPFTGDLDGAEIAIDYDNEVEGALFLILHLFGHTVQWNAHPESRDLGTRAQTNPDEEALAELEAYEREACEYSLQLLHDCGVDDLDQWLADYSRCDLAYLAHFYATGKKAPFFDFWRDDTPPLEPRAIPPFRPQRWKARWDGVVV